MYLLILFFPLLGFLFTISFGRFLGLGSFFLSTFSIFLTFLLSILAFYEVVFNFSTVYLDLGSWIHLSHLSFGWSFLFDPITVSMLFIISFISFLVHFYSIYYMFYDKHFPRFMAFLSLFTFFMILLVTSNNLLLMFFGWEGVGLVSYFLINFWFSRILANKAAFKAFLVNKFGDIFLFIALLGLTLLFGSLDLEILFSLLSLYSLSHSPFLTLLTFSLFIGIMSKSAQFGLHVWLPDAMEGFGPSFFLLYAIISFLISSQVFLVWFPFPPLPSLPLLFSFPFLLQRLFVISFLPFLQYKVLPPFFYHPSFLPLTISLPTSLLPSLSLSLFRSLWVRFPPPFLHLFSSYPTFFGGFSSFYTYFFYFFTFFFSFLFLLFSSPFFLFLFVPPYFLSLPFSFYGCSMVVFN